jgi:imidazolonepropionase
LSIIPDGSVLIRDGIIEEIGPTRRVENLAKARGAEEINCLGRVVMPGFIDSHTHLIFPLAGIGNDALAARTVRGWSCRKLQARIHLYLEAMARHGTTTVEAKTAGIADEQLEIKLLRALQGMRGAPLDVVSTLSLDPCGLTGSLAMMLAKVRRRGLARFVNVFSENSASVAAQVGFACKVHADGTDPSAEIVAGLQSGAISIDHLEHATPAQVEAIGKSSSVATLLPCSGLREGTPPAPARALIDAGAAIALATNFSPRHSPSLNMQTVVALASMRMGLATAEAISAATINGAWALDCASRTGSLEPGKSADILVLNVSDYRELSAQFGANLAYLTMRRGECIYEEAEVGPKPAPGAEPWAG